MKAIAFLLLPVVAFIMTTAGPMFSSLPAGAQKMSSGREGKTGAFFLPRTHRVTGAEAITEDNLQAEKTAGARTVTQPEYDEAVAVLTRYDIKQGYEASFRKALDRYVIWSLANENNIMSEACSERENPSVLWVIERWVNKKEMSKVSRMQPFRTIDSLSTNALLKPAQTICIKDLEPLSGKQWRRVAAPEDKPITIMLFVDAQPGTEDRFKVIYHAAMPLFRSEPGVITYQLSQFAEDSTRFVTYEKFRNEAAFQYHLNFPPIQPVIDYLNTGIKKQPFQAGLHRLIPFSPMKQQ